MGLGGIERVISIQLGRFLELGWTVLLVLDRPLPERHFPIPDGVRVFVRTSRWEDLVNVLLSEKVDVYYDQGYLELLSGEERTGEWERIKDRVGCAIYLHWHSFAARILTEDGGEAFYRALKGYRRVCDGILTLSRADCAFFASLGFRAFYVPNPVDPELDRCAAAVVAARGSGPDLVWCGRLTASKRPEDAIRVLAQVVRRRPGCRLRIVGRGEQAVERRLRDLAERLKVSSLVDFAGAGPDVYEHYRQSGIYLHTSKFEGFPMTMLEAMAFALPVVCYEMPYLELLRDNSQAVCVRQGDVAALADSVVALLSDEGRRRTAGRASRACYERFRSAGQADSYRRIFMDGRAEARPAGEDEALLVDEILSAHFDKLSQRRTETLRELSGVAGDAWFSRFLSLVGLRLSVGKIFGRSRRRGAYGRRLENLAELRQVCFGRDWGKGKCDTE